MAIKQWRVLAAAAIAAGTAFGLAACSADAPAPVVTGSDGAFDMDALVAAAKAEGGVTFYGDSSQPTVQAWTDAFTKEYGIPVTIVRNTPGPLFQQFSQEMAAGAPQADIIAIVDHTSLDEAVDNGWIAQYTPQAAGDYDQTYARDGYYYPVMNAVEQTIAYNPENLTQAQIDLIQSKGVQALEDPSFQGQVGIVQPQISSGVQSFWYLYTDGDAAADFGWDGMAALAKNASIISDTLTLGQDVIQGEINVALPIVDSYVSSQIVNNGAPLQFVYATPTIGQADGLAVVADSQHPNAARLFAEWAASPEANTLYSQISQSAPLSAKATDSRSFLDEDWYQPVGDVWSTYGSDQAFLDAMQADGPYFPKWNATTGYSG